MKLNVSLRRMTLDDLAFLLEIRNEESTRNQLENDSIFSLIQCQKWFNSLEHPWYIIRNQNFVDVGYLRTNGDVIGVDIHPEHRRNGYARQAFELYLQNKAFASLEVFEDNFALDLYFKLGFQLTGKAKIVRKRKYVRMEYKG
jgi:ribosomal protein S18 acetylase RimI-like enzyme